MTLFLLGRSYQAARAGKGCRRNVSWRGCGDCQAWTSLSLTRVAPAHLEFFSSVEDMCNWRTRTDRRILNGRDSLAVLKRTMRGVAVAEFAFKAPRDGADLWHRTRCGFSREEMRTGELGLNSLWWREKADTRLDWPWPDAMLSPRLWRAGCS